MPTALDNLAAIRDGYLAALAADAASPQPDYNIDGYEVTRAQWRASLLKSVNDANTLLIQMSPYRINSVCRT